MSEISRAIPPSDYIDGVRPVDVIVKPWPCKDCQYFDFCRDNISQCKAWRQYDSVGRRSGEWRAEDRVPDRLEQQKKLSALVKKHTLRKGCVVHNGYQFQVGSLSEAIYLVVGDCGVANNVDIAKALAERSFDYAEITLKTTTRRMCQKGQLTRLPGVGFSWGAKGQSGNE